MFPVLTQPARALFEESLALFRRAGPPHEIARVLDRLGTVALRQGDYQRARALLEEGHALFRAIGSEGGVAEALGSLGALAWVQGEVSQAADHWRAALALFRDCGAWGVIPQTLERLGRVARACGRLERAARLFGAADALHTLERWPSPTLPDHAQQVALARDQLGEAAFAAAWAAGQTLTLEEAVAEALADDEAAPP